MRIPALLLRISALLLLPALPAVAGGAKSAASPVSTSGGDWTFSLSAGPAWRQLGNVRVSGGYRSGGLTLPSQVGGDSLVTPPTGDPDLIGDRTYNDGFVGQDAGTPGDGLTWNWGYDNPAQVQGDQLVFSATGFQSVFSDARSAPGGGGSRSRDLDGFAPHLQFDARGPHRLGPFSVGFTAGLDFVNTDHSFSFSNFSQLQTRQDFRLDYVDRYELGGVIPPLAPYRGSAGGPGPVIPNLPASREMSAVPVGTETAAFSNAVSSSFDLNALSVTLGPTLSLQRGRFDFAVSAGFSLNVYDWEARQDEKLTLAVGGRTSTFASWTDRDQGVKFRPGLYLQGESAYRFNEILGLAAFARVDVARDFTVGAGPTGYEVDPGGVTAGLMLRFALP